MQPHCCVTVEIQSATHRLIQPTICTLYHTHPLCAIRLAPLTQPCNPIAPSPKSSTTTRPRKCGGMVPMAISILPVSPLIFVIFGIAFKLDCGCCHGCDPVFAFVLLVARM